MLNLLRDEIHAQGHEIVAMIVADPIKPKKPVEKNAELELAERIAPAELFNSMDNPNPSSNEQNTVKKYATFKQIADSWNIPITQLGITDVNAPRVISLLKEAQPDLGLSLRFPQIFNQEVIEIPKIGIINAHSGKLPQHRGWLPSFQSMDAGETELGCTPHWVTAELDKGNVLGQILVPIKPESDLVMNVMALYPKTCKFLASILSQLANGEHIPGKPQDTSVGKTHRYPTPERFESFVKNGNKIVDWDKYIEFLETNWSSITPPSLVKIKEQHRVASSKVRDIASHQNRLSRTPSPQTPLSSSPEDAVTTRRSLRDIGRTASDTKLSEKYPIDFRQKLALERQSNSDNETSPPTPQSGNSNERTKTNGHAKKAGKGHGVSQISFNK